MKTHVTTTVNGATVEFLCQPRQSLLEVLRDELSLTGCKEGCNNGNCGACTVMLDGVPVDSCLVLAVEAEGAEIETVEGIAEQGHLHPLQQCFLEGAALQCGICTPRFPGDREGAAGKEPAAVRTGNSIRSGRQPVPLYGLRQNRSSCAGRLSDIIGVLTR